jgi:[protein-PII] uridylyltransferase
MTAPPPSADELTAFVASLPPGYSQKYQPDVIARHIAIADARGAQPVSVGLIESESPGGHALCVVANDQPGLLATISGAMVLAGWDVIDAEAYTRKLPNARFEAIDLFWLRRQGQATPAGPTAQDAQQLQEFLSDILLGKRRFPTLFPPGVGADADSAPIHPSDTRVRFIDDNAGSLGTLEVETGDRSGLLWALSRALFEHKVQILNSQVRTRDGRVFDRFEVVELDGSPINEARRLEIQVAVLGAIEPARRRPSTPAAEARS